jgi:hypothetical protein
VQTAPPDTAADVLLRDSRSLVSSVGPNRIISRTKWENLYGSFSEKRELIRIGADDVKVWIDREAKQLIVGGREFDLSQLSPEQRGRLEAMASATLVIGGANDAVRRDLAILADELIRQNTH